MVLTDSKSFKFPSQLLKTKAMDDFLGLNNFMAKQEE